MSAMSGTAKVLRYTAFTLMTLFGLFGGLFAAGYAFADLSTWSAIGLTAAYAVPTIALSVAALRYPAQAAPWFVGLSGVVAVLTLLNAGFDLVETYSVGPVVAIGVFALAVALGFLGLHRAALSGVLLLMLGLAQFGAVVLGFSGELAEGGGPGLGAMLTTSSGVIVVPMVVVAALFLVAGLLTHESLRFWHHLPPTTRPAH
jgi:hypothetical protein